MGSIHIYGKRMVYEIGDKSALLAGGDGVVIAPADGRDPTCALIFQHGLGGNTAG